MLEVPDAFHFAMALFNSGLWLISVPNDKKSAFDTLQRTVDISNGKYTSKAISL